MPKSTASTNKLQCDHCRWNYAKAHQHGGALYYDAPASAPVFMISMTATDKPNLATPMDESEIARIAVHLGHLRRGIGEAGTRAALAISSDLRTGNFRYSLANGVKLMSVAPTGRSGDEDIRRIGVTRFW